MVQDVTLPTTRMVDKDSKFTAMGASWGNVFCGLMSVPDGVIYLAPYTHGAQRSDWTADSLGGVTEFRHGAQARCAGAALAVQFRGGRIYHQEGGIAGHEQLAEFLKNHGRPRVLPQHGFVGFSVLFSPSKDGFGGTSRSQNNQHFREWLGGSQEKAFDGYRQSVPAAGPPNFHDVTGPGSGELPADWKERISETLRAELGVDYVSCVQARITTPQAAVAAPRPPPPPAT